jgi:hypothetical protein
MQMLDVEYYHALAGAGIQYFVVEVMEVAYVERSVYLSFRRRRNPLWRVPRRRGFLLRLPW